MTINKRIAASGLAFTIAFSSFGCFSAKEEEPADYTEDVLDTAEDFCTYIKSLSLDKALKISADDVADSLDEVEPLLIFEEGDIYNAEAAAWSEAVAATIDYSIDEDSVSVSSKKAKGTVDVTFTIADHESITSADTYSDLDSMIEALGEADSIEITAVLEVILDEDSDKWVVSYCDDLIGSLFGFTDVRELSFDSALADHIEFVITEAVDTGAGYEYYNTAYISFSMSFDLEAELNKDDIYYVVYYEGTEIYTSGLTDYGSDENSFIVMFTVLDINGPVGRDYMLDEGHYSVVVYCGEEEVYTFECDCIAGEPPAMFDLTSQVGLIDFSDDPSFEPLYGDVDLERSGWYIDDVKTDGTYPSDNGYLCFRLYVNEDHGDLGCNLYYSPDPEVPQPAIPNMYLMGQEDNPVTIADDGSMYYEVYATGDTVAGYYILTIDDVSYLDPDATEVIFACCAVN